MIRSAFWKAALLAGVAAGAAPAVADGFYFGFGFGDGPRYYRSCRTYYRSAPIYYPSPAYCDDVVIVGRAPRVVYYGPPVVVHRYYPACDRRVYVHSPRRYGYVRYYYPAHRPYYRYGAHVRVYR